MITIKTKNNITIEFYKKHSEQLPYAIWIQNNKTTVWLRIDPQTQTAKAFTKKGELIPLKVTNDEEE